jgi:glycyl-tRNA synthetase beta chain
MAEFLFEIGLEEVPARMIAGAQAELQRRVVAMLERERLVAAGVASKSFSTPRRLAVWVADVASRQKDVAEELVGPAVKIAYKDGKPTAAAVAFAKKAGVDVAALKTVTTAKGEYLAATSGKAGRAAAEVIAEELPKELAGIYWAKNMVWLSSTGQNASGGGPRRAGRPERFVRPVRWLLALLGEVVVPVSFGGKTAGKVTRGHRVLAGDEAIPVGFPDEYEQTLLKAHVVADVEKRRLVVRKALDKATRAAGEGLRWREDHALVDTVTHLTEWPTVVIGAFDAEYLKLPEEVLVTVMRDHQKYFAVENAEGKLAAHFLAVLNTKADAAGEAVIRHGNERVLRARFNDARFFWEFDQRVPLKERVKLLEKVTFQKDLGSYAAKTERIRGLATKLLNESIVLSDEDALRKAVDRAAFLSKTDLTTEMVKEFTELQGQVGGLYAKHQGESDSVADAIYDQYKPQNLDDDVPRAITGDIVAIADKMSTITDMFAIGLEPTGSKDPFALRRAGNGVIKILAEGTAGRYLDIQRVLWAAINTSQRKADALHCRGKIFSFMCERFEFYLRQRCGISIDIAKAILGGSLYLKIDDGAQQNSLSKTLGFARALNEEASTPEVRAISVVFKRLRNILQQASDAKEDFVPHVKPSELKETEETSLFVHVSELEKDSRKLYESELYKDLLARIAAIQQPLSQFFERLMVMDPDHITRRNRLCLLQFAESIVRQYADFSEIVVSG